MATTRPNKNISDFKSKLIGGGARPNLFEVELTTLPDGVTGWDADSFQFLCKAAALPAQNIASIDVPNFKNMEKGQMLACMADPFRNLEQTKQIIDSGITLLSLEVIPRTLS